MKTQTTAGTPKIGMYCDLGSRTGAGHLIRSSALGSALTNHGAQVEVAANFAELPWARNQVVELGMTPLPAESGADFVRLSQERAWSGAIIDSYRVASEDLTELAAPLAAIDDDGERPLPARLVINTAAAATPATYRDWPDTQTLLLGPSFALLRQQITAARPKKYSPRSWEQPLIRVLVTLGGADTTKSSSRVATAVLTAARRIGKPVDLRVIVADAGVRAEIDQLASLGNAVMALPPTNEIAPQLRWADLTISTAGSTTWELYCLGAPAALFVVADNQCPNYTFALEKSLAVGLGDLRAMDLERISDACQTAMSSPFVLNANAQRAWSIVDGAGADRVARSCLDAFAAA